MRLNAKMFQAAGRDEELLELIRNNPGKSRVELSKLSGEHLSTTSTRIINLKMLQLIYSQKYDFSGRMVTRYYATEATA